MKLVLGMGLGLSPGDFVLDGDLAPLPQKGAEPPPQFSAHFYCGQTAGCIKMPLGMDVGLSPGDFMLDGEPVPPLRQGGGAAQIFGPCLLWPNAWMDQDATWYGGRPRSRAYATLCSMWTQLPPEKGHTHSHPIFGPCLLWPNGWMDEDAAWYGSRPWLRPHCTRRGPSSRERGTAPLPSFRPMSIVATVAHLSYC